MNNAFEILLRIAVTVRINFGSNSHFTMLILLVQEHGSSSSNVPCLPRALKYIRLFTGAPSGFLHLNTFPHRTALAGSRGFWWVVLWHSFDSESFTTSSLVFLRRDLFH